MPDLTAQHEKLARTCHADAPSTVLDRWRAICVAGLFAGLLGAGRDIDAIVGPRTDRKSGDFAVVLSEERN